MSPPPRQSSRHLFVAPSGEALPRWLEAFPRAEVAAAGALEGSIPGARLVWLRLDSAVPCVDQVAALRGKTGAATVIALADRPDDDEALALFAAGVRGYCNAHAKAADLRQVARVVEAGGLWIGPALMQRLLAATSGALSGRRQAPRPGLEARDDAPDPLAVLTAREQEVARAIADGMSNKEVARELAITERTVKAHAGSVFEKLRARDRLHLALIVNGHRSGVPRAGRSPAPGADLSGRRLTRGQAT